MKMLVFWNKYLYFHYDTDGRKYQNEKRNENIINIDWNFIFYNYSDCSAQLKLAGSV